MFNCIFWLTATHNDSLSQAIELKSTLFCHFDDIFRHDASIQEYIVYFAMNYILFISIDNGYLKTLGESSFDR